MKQYSWKNLDELFQKLNSECNYVILRNYETLTENKLLTIEHPDIDLLCDNPHKLKHCLKRVINPMVIHHKNHYWIKIGQQPVEVGIRSVNDRYYDAKWAQNMLDTKQFHPNGFYVMNTVNYFYSLIYHAVYQKSSFSDDYLTQLQIMSDELDIKSAAKTKEAYTTLLLQFMRENKYFVTCPKDFTIPMQFDRIPIELLKGRIKWKCGRILHLPERTFRYILRRLKKL